MTTEIVIKETANKAKALKALKEIKTVTSDNGTTKSGINFKKLFNIIVLF